jgi:hypothetical protein
MEYKMKEGSRLTKLIFEEIKRRFSSRIVKNCTPADTRSFARAVVYLDILAIPLKSIPEGVREVIYNGVILTSSTVSSEDIVRLFLR